jgi:putative addiction module component (TIGR02574 family)
MPRATTATPSPAEEPADLDLDHDHGEAWEREIDRRMEDVREGRVETIPAEQVFAEIDAALAKRARPTARRRVGSSTR